MNKTTILLATALTVTVAFNASSIFVSSAATAISANIGIDTKRADSTSKETESKATSNDSNAGLAEYNENATIER